MGQQTFAVMPDESIYEWDGLEYNCIHANVRIEEVEDDTIINGEHAPYVHKIAICLNPECDRDVTFEYDWSLIDEDEDQS